MHKRRTSRTDLLRSVYTLRATFPHGSTSRLVPLSLSRLQTQPKRHEGSRGKAENQVLLPTALPEHSLRSLGMVFHFWRGEAEFRWGQRHPLSTPDIWAAPRSSLPSGSSPTPHPGGSVSLPTRDHPASPRDTSCRDRPDSTSGCSVPLLPSGREICDAN